MTTDRPRAAAPGAAAPPARRRRPRQAPAARVLATGAALTATGILVAVMGASAPSSAVTLVNQPSVAGPVAAAAPPPTTIVIVHRPAASSTPVVAPSAGRAIPAARPTTRTPAPVATSSAS